MNCFSKGLISWIRIPKNASMSWTYSLQNDGWILEDIYQYTGKWHERRWFGFLRDPNQRHTLGVIEALRRQNLLSLVDDDAILQLLSSSVLDVHSYPVCQMLPDELVNQTHWFILDSNDYNYETLARNFCKYFNVILPSIIKTNISDENIKSIQHKFNLIKQKNHNMIATMNKHLFEKDILLYYRWVQLQYRYDINEFQHQIDLPNLNIL